MAVFILNWNPSKWEMPEEEILSAIAITERGGEYTEPWSVGVRTRGIGWGDRAYLLRQHADRGIVASGYFTSGVREDDHWDGSGRVTTYADVSWTTWLPIEDRLPTEVLRTNVPGVAWDRLQASGTQVPSADAPGVDRLWEDHLASLGREITASPDEVPPSERYHEGAVTRTEVNRYERDPRARRACIDHHGAACSICEFDFGSVYGDLGAGYIQVHHVRPLSELPDGYEVDPVGDLLPVCPNCHAMLHRERPTLSVDALRSRLRA